MKIFTINQSVIFSNVMSARQEIEKAITAAADDFELALPNNMRFDSSLLSLLLCARRCAKQQNKTVFVSSVPERLLQVAHVYGVSNILQSMIRKPNG
jgi:ABC-type transporter Mla MlaB component